MQKAWKESKKATDLLEEARDIEKTLSGPDKKTLNQKLNSVITKQVKVMKFRKKFANSTVKLFRESEELFLMFFILRIEKNSQRA